MIDLETKRTIGEILKDQSQTKDMILYDLLIDGSINIQENTERQKYENEKNTKEVTKENIDTKPKFKKGCKRDDCRFNKDGFCSSNAVNSNSLNCSQATNYIGFEGR